MVLSTVVLVKFEGILLSKFTVIEYVVWIHGYSITVAYNAAPFVHTVH